MNDFNDEVQRLLEDDRLLKWVISPDEETAAYWEKWMQEHPDSITALFKAREIAQSLVYTQRPADISSLVDSIWTGINAEIDGAATPAAPAADMSAVNEPAADAQVLSMDRKPRKRLLIAASFTGIALLAGSLLFYHKKSAPELPAQSVANLLVKEDLDRVNQTDRSQVVYLVDGSKVTLLPGAGIRHAAFLQKDKREIYLEGDAFFEVAKDSKRPFYVYSGDLVVHVLGTSFKVATNKHNGDVTVLVKTGKVAVSPRNGDARQSLILESDQKALFKGVTRNLVQVHPDKLDKQIDEEAPALSFNFDETPVTRIFQTLESAYGIPFHYDEKTFSHCVVTTNLADEPLEEKIKIVCAAIGASYAIKDKGVFLEGTPCK